MAHKRVTFGESAEAFGAGLIRTDPVFRGDFKKVDAGRNLLFQCVQVVAAETESRAVEWGACVLHGHIPDSLPLNTILPSGLAALVLLGSRLMASSLMCARSRQIFLSMGMECA